MSTHHKQMTVLVVGDDQGLPTFRDEPVQGTSSRVGLSVRCWPSRASPQLNRCVSTAPAQTDPPRYPRLQIWRQDAESSNLPNPTTSG